METNPFYTLPLESTDSDLLVGRNHLLQVLSQYMQFRSHRRILLLGEHGSGRTSLLRCASKAAPLTIYIDHITPSDAGNNLLKEICSHFVHANVPQNRVELTNRILQAAQDFPNALPLVVIDASTVDISALNVALRDTLPILERLEALIVVVLETKDKNQLSQSVLQQLEQMNPLSNLDVDEVQLLVERRVERLTGQPFSFRREDAEYLLEKTQGLPAEVIRVMRNAIDSSKMSQYTYVEPQYKSNALVTEPLFSPEPVDPTIHSSLETIFSDAVESPGSEPEMQSPVEVSEQQLDSKIFENMEDFTNNFDLNLEQLSEDQENQDELVQLEPLENLGDGYSAAPMSAKPESIDLGPPELNAPRHLKGLFSRNREYVGRSHQDETPGKFVEVVDGVELWEDPSLHPPEPEDEPISEEESAFLMHDEVGMFEIDAEIDDTPMVEPEFIEEFEEDQTTVSAAPELLSELAQMVPLMKALEMALLEPNGANQTQNRRKIVDALEGMQRKRTGIKQDYPLNAALLSLLTPHEIEIISVANERRFSPSDSELCTQLNIKRSRLSQISNRLLKGGILSVRPIGRNRYYELTQAARAQLIAWNVIGGEA
tara:strand:- start:502 stop:2304 length:1803 start_codon:yes stop_codon:yes gene_type:complete